MKNSELLSIIRETGCGNVKDLERHLGKENFDYLVNKNLIYVGKSFPGIWRITEKGIKRYNASKDKLSKVIALILWKLHLTN